MYSIINSLPKAEHHIHLVGSIRPETLLWVADESGLDNQWDSVEEVHNFFKFSDFPNFLKVFGTCMAYITKESMFERIAYETLEDQAEYQRLCLPESPDFILDHPDYYALFTYSMFHGKVIDTPSTNVRPHGLPRTPRLKAQRRPTVEPRATRGKGQAHDG